MTTSARPAASSGGPDRPCLPRPVPRVRPARPGRDLPGPAQGHPCFTAPAIGEIARQIGARGHHVAGPPEALPRPCDPARLNQGADAPPGPVPAPASRRQPGRHRRRAGPGPDGPRPDRHLHRDRRPVRPDLGRRGGDRLDQRPPDLVHLRRAAPRLARRRHRGRGGALAALARPGGGPCTGRPKPWSRTQL